MLGSLCSFLDVLLDPLYGRLLLYLVPPRSVASSFVNPTTPYRYLPLAASAPLLHPCPHFLFDRYHLASSFCIRDCSLHHHQPPATDALSPGKSHLCSLDHPLAEKFSTGPCLQARLYCRLCFGRVSCSGAKFTTLFANLSQSRLEALVPPPLFVVLLPTA